MTRKIKGHESANVRIVESGNKLLLVSYTTTVCTVDAGGWLTCTGTYSATTRKHIGWFVRNEGYAIGYHDVKKAYEDCMQVNIWTGEFKPMNNERAAAAV